jgi:hypothetical protein
MSDTSLGTFVGGAAGFTGMALNSTAEDVSFTFKAGQKPGALTLTFKGTVPGLSAAAGQIVVTVPLKVVVCQYHVTVISNWFVAQGTGGSIALVALVQGASLTLEGDDMYSGIAEVTWIPSVVLPDGCSHNDSVAPSMARLKANISDEGVLALEVKYDEAVLIETGACPPQDINTASSMTPDTLRVDLPGVGGTVRPDQLLNAPELIPGNALILVQPVGQ